MNHNYEKVKIRILSKIEELYDKLYKKFYIEYGYFEKTKAIENLKKIKVAINFEKTSSIIDFLTNMWELSEFITIEFSNNAKEITNALGKIEALEGNELSEFLKKFDNIIIKEFKGVTNNEKKLVIKGFLNDIKNIEDIREDLETIKNIAKSARDDSLRICYGNDIQGIKKQLSDLKNYYTHGTLSYVLDKKNNVDVIDDEDKNLNYVSGNNINIISLYKDKNETLEKVKNEDKNNFFHSDANNADNSNEVTAGVNNFFYYSVKGEEENDNNKLIKASDKFIFLIDKLIKTLTPEGDTYKNYYKDAVKKYFYEELLSKYRTLNIDEEFKININYKESNKSSTELLIPTLYNRLDGKSGNLGSQRIIEHSRRWKQQKETEPLFVLFDELSLKEEIGDNDTINYYINIKIDIDNFDIEQKEYLRKKEKFNNDIFKDYLEKNIFNYCKLVIFGCKEEATKENEKDLFYLTSDLRRLELLTSSIKTETEEISLKEYIVVDFRLDDEELVSKLKSLKKYLKDFEGCIKFNYIEHKLQDNFVSNSNSSTIVTRNSYSLSKEFISALDDRAFSLTSINKSFNNLKNNVRIFKKIDENNSLNFIIDINDFSLKNGVETMKYVKILSKKGTFVLPIKKIEVKYSYKENDRIFTVENSNFPYITDRNLLSQNDFSTTLGENFTVDIQNNSLIIDSDKNLKGPSSLLIPNDNNDSKLTVFNRSVKTKIKKENYKYLILERIDTCPDGTDCSEYFKYLEEKEDIVSIIGFSQSQNCDCYDSYLY